MIIIIVIIIIIAMIILIIVIFIIITTFILHEKFQNLTGFPSTWFHLSSPALISKASTYLFGTDNQGLIPDNFKSFVDGTSNCYVVHHCPDQWAPGTPTSI